MNATRSFLLIAQLGVVALYGADVASVPAADNESITCFMKSIMAVLGRTDVDKSRGEIVLEERKRVLKFRGKDLSFDWCLDEHRFLFLSGPLTRGNSWKILTVSEVTDADKLKATVFLKSGNFRGIINEFSGSNSDYVFQSLVSNDAASPPAAHYLRFVGGCPVFDEWVGLALLWRVEGNRNIPIVSGYVSGLSMLSDAEFLKVIPHDKVQIDVPIVQAKCISWIRDSIQNEESGQIGSAVKKSLGNGLSVLPLPAIWNSPGLIHMADDSNELLQKTNNDFGQPVTYCLPVSVGFAADKTERAIATVYFGIIEGRVVACDWSDLGPPVRPFKKEVKPEP